MTFFDRSHRVYVIGEVGQAHDGSLGIAHSYIDALADAGVSAAKFQMHIADAESSSFETFRVPFSYEDKTRYDYWKRMEFTAEQWAGLKEHCGKRCIDFLVSPFSVRAFELLESLQVTQYKIASGEVANYLLLDKIIATKKPILLSSGLSDVGEMKTAIARINEVHNSLVLFQCTTQYPTQPGSYGLNLIPELKAQFKMPVGLSDHSGKVFPSIAAVALGAEALEVHVAFDRAMFGPDSRSSLLPAEIKQLVEGVSAVALDQEVYGKVKTPPQNAAELKRMFGKSLTVRRDIPAKQTIAIDDLESSKPGDQGIPADQYLSVVGRSLSRALKAREFIRLEDLL